MITFLLQDVSLSSPLATDKQRKEENEEDGSLVTYSLKENKLPDHKIPVVRSKNKTIPLKTINTI